MKRVAAWGLFDGATGPDVLLDIDKGVLLKRLVLKPRVKSWWFWADLSVVARPNWVKARIQAVMQSAGVGSAEMVAIGQPGVDTLSTCGLAGRRRRRDSG
jgi:hypothetical protein